MTGLRCSTGATDGVAARDCREAIGKPNEARIHLAACQNFARLAFAVHAMPEIDVRHFPLVAAWAPCIVLPRSVYFRSHLPALTASSVLRCAPVIVLLQFREPLRLWIYIAGWMGNVNRMFTGYALFFCSKFGGNCRIIKSSGIGLRPAICFKKNGTKCSAHSS